MAQEAASKKPLTKTELLSNIAAATDLPKQQVAAVIDALTDQIKQSLGNEGPGAVTLPGLVKIERKSVAARFLPIRSWMGGRPAILPPRTNGWQRASKKL